MAGTLCVAALMVFRSQKETAIPYKNALVLGNSITFHIADAGLGWYSAWGMAASVPEKDFVHILSARLAIPVTPVNISEWEHNYNTYNLSLLDSTLSIKYDLIIIRLGDNINDTVGLRTSFAKFINYIKAKRPKARIVMSGRLFKNDMVELAMKDVAGRNGLKIIELFDLSQDSRNISSIGTTLYKHDGTAYKVTNKDVAVHPNDFGMQNIASRIYNEIINGL